MEKSFVDSSSQKKTGQISSKCGFYVEIKVTDEETLKMVCGQKIVWSKRLKKWMHIRPQSMFFPHVAEEEVVDNTEDSDKRIPR